MLRTRIASYNVINIVVLPIIESMTVQDIKTITSDVRCILYFGG